MQTFLPEANFWASAAALDNKRLGKQRVEVLQILNALAGNSKGWVNHPATRMWRGYEGSLAYYGLVICDEWTNRGFKDTCAYKIDAVVAEHFSGYPVASPPWFGDPSIHLSHQSNLIRKDPDHYGPLWPSVGPDLPYVWPVQ